LLFRFLHLNKEKDLETMTDEPETDSSYYEPDKNINPYILLNMAAGTMVSTDITVKKPDKMLVECPSCNKFFGVISVSKKNEVPCPHCGVVGIVNIISN
jgi:hypothetical protein